MNCFFFVNIEVCTPSILSLKTKLLFSVEYIHSSNDDAMPGCSDKLRSFSVQSLYSSATRKTEHLIRKVEVNIITTKASKLVAGRGAIM